MMIANPSSNLILVVDDQEAVTKMLSRILENEEFQIQIAHNGEKALEEANRLLPDLILLDVMMPGITGFDVLTELKKVPATQNIPVILITAKDTPADIAHGFELGADDYIPKPFHPRELIARVRAKLKSRHLEETLFRRTKELESLLRVSEALNRDVQTTELLNIILYLVLDLLPGNVAAIYQINEQNEIIDYRVSHEDGSLDNDRYNHAAILEDFQNIMQPILWPSDVPLIEEFPYGMAIPMIQGSELNGLLILMGEEPYDHNHFVLFEGIGRQAALALHNATLFELKVQYAEHLEDMVEERTAELQSAQQLLMRSEKLASLGRLAAGIAHEINNPLLPLRLNLERMAEDIQEGYNVELEDVNQTLDSVKRIGRIVDRFQEFTGKGRSSAPSIQELDLSKIIESVVALNQTFFSKEDKAINMDLSPIPSIYGNRDQLEQVFLNLTINANAAMSKGDSLTIQAFEANGDIIIRFTDTGHGIPSDLIDSIFEPFVSDKENGSGLGLFISYNIIQNHNGQIEVESESDQGTTFTIRLPISQETSESTELR